MARAFTNGKILGPKGWLENYAVLVRGGTIENVVARENVPKGTDTVNLDGNLLLPGFIDVQVNGGGGVLFNSDPNLKGITSTMAAHRRYGTTGMLPTIISDDFDVIAKAIAAVEDAINRDIPGILGIHIEGPFLSKAKKGAHDASKFRILDDEAITLLSSLKSGVTLVTLAPEETTPEMIQKLRDNGVIVSMGHTDATYAEAKAGLDAGVTGFTHLYNAMSQMTAREPGVVGAALSDNNSYAGVIVDRHHVAHASLLSAINAKGVDQIILVTDAMPSVGAKDKNFALSGMRVSVEGGKCVLANGTLAGSDLDMASAVRNTRDWLGLRLQDAANMASTVPATFLGITDTHGTIEAGKYANFVLVDKGLNVLNSWIKGVSHT